MFGSGRADNSVREGAAVPERGGAARALLHPGAPGRRPRGAPPLHTHR